MHTRRRISLTTCVAKHTYPSPQGEQRRNIIARKAPQQHDGNVGRGKHETKSGAIENTCGSAILLKCL